MDISKLAVNELADVHLQGPDGELLFDGTKPVTITVYGPGTKQFQRAQQNRNNALLERVQRKGGKKADTTLEEAAAFLAGITKSFNNFDYKGNKGHDAIKKCYAAPDMGWIAEQVNREVNDWQNFIPASIKS